MKKKKKLRNWGKNRHIGAKAQAGAGRGDMRKRKKVEERKHGIMNEPLEERTEVEKFGPRHKDNQLDVRCKLAVPKKSWKIVGGRRRRKSGITSFALLQISSHQT